MFQPGEEGPGGAEPMIEEGLVNADAGFALHINPNHPTGLIATRLSIKSFPS
ncbi:MAG: M20/M25/M40 family metallo-hydrolase [Chloroflexota bacterium]